jgi:hypothetical protein
MCRTRMWPVMAGACFTASALRVLALPSLASAQQAGAADELTEAILRYTFRYDGGNVRLVQGSVPDDLKPNLYLPSGTRVLGSVVTGSSVLVLATSTAPPESLRTEYVRALAPRGWKAFEPMRQGGFVDSGADRPLIFCRENAQLEVVHSRRSSASIDLYLRYRDGWGPCEHSRSAAFRAISEPELPTLHSPPGALGESRIRCSGRAPGRRSGMATSTMILASMTAEEVLRHYARQVESEGWRPAAASGPAIATGRWMRADTTGTTELTLQVRELAPPGVRCYEVEMRVSSDVPR